ncbi:uncharacterized protein LOC141529210 [Cotesia typhae]|uniref:uncharacterized protein LOC141529210 n=1 Tax=Cotesia typhae TaxID=2053667 RepID=UPI003D69C1BE
MNVKPGVEEHELIVQLRPRQLADKIPKDTSDFAVCPSCKVSTTKKFLSAHFANCTGHTVKRRRIIKKMSLLYETEFHPDTCKKLRRLIVNMHVDEASTTLKHDDLLIRYGNMLCDKYKHDQNDELIRNRLRLMARLLNASKAVEAKMIEKAKLKNYSYSKKPINDMLSLFDPENVKICIKAVNILAGIDEKTYDSKAPSVASSCGQFLKQLGDFLISENIQEKKKENNENIKDFIHVITRKWADIINKNVDEARAKLRRKKKKEKKLPSAEDIYKLTDYLTSLQKKAYNKLLLQYSHGNYNLLAKTTLLRVQIFNRRRPGETERIFIEDFEDYDKLSEENHPDIMKTLSEEAKKLCDKYVRFSVRGKQNFRDATVILDEMMLKGIKLLIENRKNHQVLANNPYIFAVPGCSSSNHKYLRSCELMRKFSKECGAKMPSNLRATELRKHIATYFINHNINNIDRTKIAKHLGHTMGVHENYYHLSNIVEEICELPVVLSRACGMNNPSTSTNDQNMAQDVTTDDDSSDHDSSDSDADELNNTKESTKCSKDYSDISVTVSSKRKVWTSAEINALKEHFGEKFAQRKYPSSKEMNAARKKDSRLASREISVIRSWFSNQYNKKSKKN